MTTAINASTLPAIRAENLSVSFSSRPDTLPALSNLSLSIKEGEFVSIVGPSGCGKSTLLRLLALLLFPTSGRLQIDLPCLVEAPEERPTTAFVFQEPRLLPWRTVDSNIRLPLELDKVPREKHDDLVAAALALIGLTEHDSRKYPRMLSGGMKMRVSLARALVRRPRLMLLDEPFAALDDVLRQQLNEELLRLWSEQKWTGVFVTHNVSEAVYLSRRVLVMSRAPGRIIGEYDIPFGDIRPPGLRATPEFAKLAGEISRTLRNDA